MQNAYLKTISSDSTLLPDLLRSLIPQRHTQKMADPDPMTFDPGSRVYDPDLGTVIPDPIYLVTTLNSFVKCVDQTHLTSDRLIRLQFNATALFPVCMQDVLNVSDILDVL